MNKLIQSSGLYSEYIKKKQKSAALSLFIIISTSLLLFIGQDEVINSQSIKYLLIVLPAVILPFTKASYVIANFIFKSWPIFIMLVLSTLWSLFYKNDIHSLYRLVLFLLVISWLEVSRVTLSLSFIKYFYYILIIIAIIIYLVSDNNHWGILPGATDREFGVWRISLFPNIANTGFISLFVFFVFSKDKLTIKQNKLILLISIYFIMFSFVRTAIIGMLAYIIFYVVFDKIKGAKFLFFSSIMAMILLNLFVGYAGYFIELLQSIPIFSRLFLRGEHALTHQEIYVQMYRPWVWKQQLSIFLNSDYLMGEGIYDFNKFIDSSIRGDKFEETDSVSFILGLLASYGCSAFLFYYYIVRKNYLNAIKLDKWACAIFPVIIFIAMQWGSILHPATVTFVLFFLILIKGKRGFIL